MPFDFLSHNLYTINYEEFLTKSIEIFPAKDKNLKYQYFKKWINLLKTWDDQCRNYVLINENNVMQTIIDTQIFQFKIPMYDNVNNTAGFHFNIDNVIAKLKSVLSQKDLAGRSVPIDKFVEDNAQIKWDVASSTILRSNSLPLLIVPFLFGQFDYLLIDGNHRLTNAIKNKEKQIDAIFISSVVLQDQQTFMSRFDQLFYLFNYEIVHFANEIYYVNLPFEHLLKKSLLNTHFATTI